MAIYQIEIDHEEIAEEVANQIDLGLLAQELDSEEMARYHDPEDVAEHIDLSKLAQYIDLDSLSGYIPIQAKFQQQTDRVEQLEREVTELASRLSVLERPPTYRERLAKFVEKVWKKPLAGLVFRS